MTLIAIQQAEDRCTFPGCSSKSDREGFCVSHAKYFAGPKPKKQPITIAKKSAKRAKIDRKQYTPNAKQYILEHPVCNIQMEGVCTFKSECVNHTKGKSSIELLLDETFWEPSCFACNNAIEANDAWAREHGHKVSKFTKPIIQA